MYQFRQRGGEIGAKAAHGLTYVETFSGRLLAPCTLRPCIERSGGDAGGGVVFPLEEIARGSLRIWAAPEMPSLVRAVVLDYFEHRR